MQTVLYKYSWKEFQKVFIVSLKVTHTDTAHQLNTPFETFYSVLSTAVILLHFQLKLLICSFDYYFQEPPSVLFTTYFVIESVCKMRSNI